MKKKFIEWVIWSITIVWGFIVLKNYYSTFKFNFKDLSTILSLDQYIGILNLGNLLIFKHLLSILFLLFFLFSAFSLGRVILRFFKLQYFNNIEEIVFSLGLGLGIFAYLVFLIGIVGLLYSSVIYIVVLLFVIVGFIDLKKHPIKIVFSFSFENPEEKLNLIDIFAISVLIIAMLINLIGALSPEVFYDSLVYHLGVPNYYRLNHKILNMPYVFLSNMPAVAGMLFTAGLLLKDEILSKLINYSTGVICCLVLISISIRYQKLKVGIWASLVFYTIIHVMVSSWSCGTEIMLTFFGLLAFYSIINFSNENKGWLFLSAVFAGFAMGVKYTGLFITLGVFCVYMVVEKFSIKNIFIWGLISSVIVAPWLIKNYIYKKNPVYPYMGDVFPKDQDSDYEKLKVFIVEAKQMGSSGLKNWLKHPWDVTMGKVPNSKEFTPLFLFLMPLFLFFGRPPNIIKYSIVYFIVVWLTWSFSSTMIRFMMPAYPAAGLIIAYYLNSEFYKLLKKMLLWIVFTVSVASICWSGLRYYNMGSWEVVCGKQSKEDFLSTTHLLYPSGYYAATNFINKNLPKDAKVLFIGEGRSFYVDRMPVVSSAYDLTPIVEFAKSSNSADELYLRIKHENITHIFFNMGEAIRLGKSYRMFEWDEKSLNVYNDFWKKYVKEIFNKDEIINGNFANRVAVYEILSEKEAVIPHVLPFNLMAEIVVKNINLSK